jgi:hypothetical protein
MNAIGHPIRTALAAIAARREAAVEIVEIVDRKPCPGCGDETYDRVLRANDGVCERCASDVQAKLDAEHALWERRFYAHEVALAAEVAKWESRFCAHCEGWTKHSPEHGCLECESEF